MSKHKVPKRYSNVMTDNAHGTMELIEKCQQLLSLDEYGRKKSKTFIVHLAVSELAERLAAESAS